MKSSQLSITEVRLRSAEEERDTLKQDLEGSNLGKDEVIKKAWETRDSAVKRKNASEVELARERIAVMQVITSIPYHGSEGLWSAFSTIFLRVATRAGRAGELEEASRLRRADDSEPARPASVATSKKLWKSAP